MIKIPLISSACNTYETTLWVCGIFSFSFSFSYYKQNQVSILKNSPLFSTSPEHYFGMVIKTNKINYCAKCLPLCKINYIQYNASHITLYLCSTVCKKRTNKQKQKQTYQWEQKPKTWGSRRRNWGGERESKKSVRQNKYSFCFWKVTSSSSYEINVQEQSSNPQLILRTKHS